MTYNKMNDVDESQDSKKAQKNSQELKRLFKERLSITSLDDVIVRSANGDFYPFSYHYEVH
jgi:hypothetical protein